MNSELIQAVVAIVAVASLVVSWVDHNQRVKRDVFADLEVRVRMQESQIRDLETKLKESEADRRRMLEEKVVAWQKLVEQRGERGRQD